MSPSLINPALRIASEIKYVKNAGAMICMTSIMTITVTAEVPPVVIVLYVIIGPTNPAVPIPEPIALFVIFKTTVEIGPRMVFLQYWEPVTSMFLFPVPIDLQFHSPVNWPSQIRSSVHNTQSLLLLRQFQKDSK